MSGDQQDKSLKDEYETLLNKVKQLGLELEASRLTSSYSSIRYHALNPDEEARTNTVQRFAGLSQR